MAFGQQSGPPATSTQVRELLSLLDEAGHGGFREARGSMGFTQRQAGGRFTRDEASDVIDRLREAADERAGDAPTIDRPGSARPAPSPQRQATGRPGTNAAAIAQVLRHMPSDQLAAELQRRGWLVVQP